MLRRRGLAPSYVPPISVVLAARRDDYIQGLTRFCEGDVEGWIEQFAVAAATSAALAERYLAGVGELQERWREMVRDQGGLRSDAAAWSLIAALPGNPVISAPVATAIIDRSKSSTAVAIDQLVDAGVLLALSTVKRNRVWEAEGLLDLLADLDPE